MDHTQEKELVALSALPNPNLQYHFLYQVRDNSLDRYEKPHIHDSYEIYINLSGDVSVLVNNNLYKAQKGDAIITRPGDVHLCINHADAPHARFCLWFQCSEDSPLIAFTKRQSFNPFLRHSEDTKKELLRLLYQLKDAQDENREPERTICLYRLLILFAEGCQTTPDHAGLPAGMQKVLDYMNENFTQIHCVNDIVKATHTSSPTLTRWFRTHLQLSPHKYMEALKLSLAQRLLLEGKSVTEACNLSGFPDYSRFISVFKNKFGQTPLQYQKSHK